jgi:hypothetical protein
LLNLSMRRPSVTWLIAEPPSLTLLAPRTLRRLAGAWLSILPTRLPAALVAIWLLEVPAVAEHVIVVVLVVAFVSNARLTLVDPRWDVPGHRVVDVACRHRVHLCRRSRRLIRAATSISTMSVMHLGHLIMGIMGTCSAASGGHLECTAVLDMLPSREPRVTALGNPLQRLATRGRGMPGTLLRQSKSTAGRPCPASDAEPNRHPVPLRNCQGMSALPESLFFE